MARCRIMLYSFTESNGEVKINIDLTRFLVDYYNHTSEQLVVNLPNVSKPITLKKKEYLNTGKVFCIGKYFFIVATKFMGKKQALKFLLRYAVERSEARLILYQKLLAA